MSTKLQNISPTNISSYTVLKCLQFNLGKWSNPSIIGQCMLPAYAFIMEKINNTRAVLFGGVKTYDDAQSIVTNNIYILEISISTVVC